LPGYDAEFNELSAAKEWGLTPAAWRAQSFDDRALMLALILFDRTREAYREEHRKERRERSGRKDETSFAAMRHRLRLKE
jgi:hypothetical protein